MSIKPIQNLRSKIEEKRSENSVLWRPIILLKDAYIKVRTILFVGKYRTHLVGNKKAIYFAVPKVASSSLGIMFETGMVNLKESKLRKYDDYFKFTFVRNPYSRMLACYLNKIKGHHGFLNGMWIDFWKFKGKFYPDMSFKEFVKSIYSISDKKSDIHFQSQSVFIVNKRGKIIPDFIGRFETLKEDYNKVCGMIEGGFDKPLISLNRSGAGLKLDDYYDEETKRLIYERYKGDFKLFGYDK